MALANNSIQKTQLQNATISHLLAALDPKTLILSKFSLKGEKTSVFELDTGFYVTERGPRYEEYAKLREKRFRMRKQFQEPEIKFSTPKKEEKFKDFKGYNVAQSVPDFSNLLRKENNKPVAVLPPMKNSLKTPVKSPMNSRLNGSGVKSVNFGEKKSLRKSYANMEELKGFSVNRGESVGSKTVLSYKKY